MPTKLLHNDASLIAGTDHASTWKKQPDSAFYESDTSFSQTSGTFSNGGITSVDFYNNTPNSILVESHMHIAITNGDSSNTIQLAGIANLIAKLTVYVNNVEIFKINSVNNCALMEQLQQLKDADGAHDFVEIFNNTRSHGSKHDCLYNHGRIWLSNNGRGHEPNHGECALRTGQPGGEDQDRNPVAHRQLSPRRVLIHACGCRLKRIQLLNLDQLLHA